MVEEAKSLPPGKEDLASWTISQDVVYQIMRYLPTYIIDDPQERKEEVHFTKIQHQISSFSPNLSIVRVLYPGTETLHQRTPIR